MGDAGAVPVRPLSACPGPSPLYWHQPCARVNRDRVSVSIYLSRHRASTTVSISIVYVSRPRTVLSVNHYPFCKEITELLGLRMQLRYKQTDAARHRHPRVLILCGGKRRAVRVELLKLLCRGHSQWHAITVASHITVARLSLLLFSEEPSWFSTTKLAISSDVQSDLRHRPTYRHFTSASPFSRVNCAPERVSS